MEEVEEVGVDMEVDWALRFSPMEFQIISFGGGPGAIFAGGGIGAYTDVIVGVGPDGLLCLSRSFLVLWFLSA